MKLTVFSGSPRGKGGNTEVFVRHLLQGWESIGENGHETLYLRRVKDAEQFVQAFAGAECVLFAFPLYTDAMPGIVKAFIESLAPLRRSERATRPSGSWSSRAFPRPHTRATWSGT